MSALYMALSWIHHIPSELQMKIWIAFQHQLFQDVFTWSHQSLVPLCADISLSDVTLTSPTLSFICLIIWTKSIDCACGVFCPLLVMLLNRSRPWQWLTLDGFYVTWVSSNCMYCELKCLITLQCFSHWIGSCISISRGRSFAGFQQSAEYPAM